MMGGRTGDVGVIQRQSGSMGSWRNGRGTRKVRGCRAGTRLVGMVENDGHDEFARLGRGLGRWATMGVGVTDGWWAWASRALGRGQVGPFALELGHGNT